MEVSPFLTWRRRNLQPSVPVAVLNNPNAAYFGSPLAISGQKVLLGAYRENTGSVYVYDLANPTPTVPVITLHNPAPAEDGWFSHSVAISGTRVIVSALHQTTNASFAEFAGNVYIYDLASATPTVPTLKLS